MNQLDQQWLYVQRKSFEVLRDQVWRRVELILGDDVSADARSLALGSLGAVLGELTTGVGAAELQLWQ